MRRILFVVLLLLVPIAMAGAVCDLPRPNPPPGEPGDRPPPEPPRPPPTAEDPPPPATPPTTPPGGTPSPDPVPPDDGAGAPAPDPGKPGPDPKPPGESDPDPEKGGPKDEPPSPPAPPVPPAPFSPPPVGRANPPPVGPRTGRPSGRAGPSVSLANAWGLWWEMNRAHMLGLKKTIPARAPATAGGEDPRIPLRGELLTALRHLAAKSADQELRATSLRALGRVGSDQDVRTFLDLLRDQGQPTMVREGAAIGLACIKKIEDDDLRREVRRYFQDLLDGFVGLPVRLRELGILAISLRARDDPALARALGVHCKRPVRSATTAAALLYACGLTKDEFLAFELRSSVRSGMLGRRRLHDITRSNAVLGLSLAGKDAAVKTLTEALRADELGAQSRRSALLGLGILLREPIGGEALRVGAEKAVAAAFAKNGDPIAAGYAAMAMGTARSPFGVAELMKCVDKTGDAVVRPFAALAMGLAVDRLDSRMRNHVRSFLLKKLTKTRNIHLAGALSIAAAVANIREARGTLIERAEDGRQFTGIRTNAIEALGILGCQDQESMGVLLAALDDGAPSVVQSASVALGFAGDQTIAKRLVAKLAEAPWKAVQTHMVVGLSHLGGTAAVKPLLALLSDSGAKSAVRCSAATVLGILLDESERDPLFEIDACFNPYALTSALRELVRVY